MSLEEYLIQERAATVKSEYRGGAMYAMSRGTIWHSRLSVRITSILERIFVECQVCNSDMKVYTAAVKEAMYPDASVVCGEPEFLDGGRDVVLNPMLVFEVLSPSTRSDDKGLKADFYRSIPSLKALVLVESERPFVQVQSRHESGWLLEDFAGLESSIVLGGSAVTLAQIYERIL